MSKHHDNGGWTTADREKAKPILAATLPAPCVDCGRPIYHGDRWQVGHIVSKAQAAAMGWSNAQSNALSNLGPSHAKARGQRACNQIAGGKLGRAMQLGTVKRDERGEPDW
jgi:hypothetical protein